MADKNFEEEKSLFDFHSMQEIKEHFSLAELFDFAKKKNLGEWLETNLYFEEAKKIFDALENELSDAEFKLLICKIFSFDFSKLSAEEFEAISNLISRNQRRDIYVEQREGDNRKIAFIETQTELIKALKDGAEVLYLYGGEFKIPHTWYNRTYIGRNNAIIDFNFDGDIDFDERDIIFEDLQIFIHYPVTLKISKSKNVKIIDGGRKFIGEHPTLKEMAEIMQGRGAFESAENFKSRAENLRGVAVGVVLLEDKNYIFDDKFILTPQWNFDFISVLKDFVADNDLFLYLDAEKAQLLYTNERKLQIFADFTYIKGKLQILNLYLETKPLSRLEINFVVRKKISDAENLIDLEFVSSNKISSAALAVLGYGLALITAYKQTDEEVF